MLTNNRKTGANSTYAQVGTTEGSERTELLHNFADGVTGRWFFFAAQCIAAKRYAQPKSTSQPTMVKRILIILISGLVSSISYGQTLACENLAKQLYEEQAGSIFHVKSIFRFRYDSIPLDYYCIGKYFSQRDIDSNIFLIQTDDGSFNNSENLWKVCRYESYGFNFHNPIDFIQDNYSLYYNMFTEFIKGYNEISEAYLKAKIGDSAFAHLNDIPKGYFNPQNFLYEKLQGNYKRFFHVDIINNTTINVKLMVDSLFKEYPQFVLKVDYEIAECEIANHDDKDFSCGELHLMDNKEIKETGFRVTKSFNDLYRFKISFRFDHKAIAAEGKYDWCELMDRRTYAYHLYLTAKK